MMIQRRIPNNIVQIYLALTNKKDRIRWAIDNHYNNPTSISRSKLVQEICRVLKGKHSVRIINANLVIEFLDQYNTITERTDYEADIDFDEATLLSILNKGDR